MKKVDHLLIAETNEGLPPLLNDFAPLLSQFSEMPVSVFPLEEVLQIHGHPAPQLQLLHTDLTSMHHLGQVIELCSAFPHSSIVIVSSKQDEQLCLLALEAGADDAILAKDLTPLYLQKRVLLSRRNTPEKQLVQSREQLLACLQNAPDVAVQGNNIMVPVQDLTGQMEIQERLQKEIVLSDTIINSLPGLFYLIKKDGGQLRWNKQLEIISGYTAEEISRMSPLDFVGGDDVYDVFQAIEKVFETGSSHVEASVVTKDGRHIPFYLTGTAIEYGGVECLLGTGIDLSAMKHLENELAEQKIAGQKKIMQAMIEAEENEKGKLGLELHDNVNQILSVVRMYMAILNSDQQIEGVTLPKAMALLNTAIEEIRHLSHRLAVGYKFETGLAAALEDAVENIQAAKEFSINLFLSPDLDERTNLQQKLAVYRIVQEQLNNVMKHAKASHVGLSVSLTEDEIQLKIEDDGKGFDPSKAKKGLGLNNMINRAEALNGRATVYSRPGKGVKIDVVIPLEVRGSAFDVQSFVICAVSFLCVLLSP